MPEKGIKVREMMQLKMPAGQNIASVYSCWVFFGAIIFISMDLDWHDKAISDAGISIKCVFSVSGCRLGLRKGVVGIVQWGVSVAREGGVVG